MEGKQPVKATATLISFPENPLGTLFYVWRQSRTNDPIPSPREIEELLDLAKGGGKKSPIESTVRNLQMLGFNWDQVQECAAYIRSELQMILSEGIPVTENLNFTFHLQNIPVSLREQLVRHRIGSIIDHRVGVDIIPEGTMRMDIIPNLAESTWWSQTSRVIPHDKFFDEGRYILPEALQGKTVQLRNGNVQSAEEFYKNQMWWIQEAYKTLMKAGVHIEDCRQLIPMGATHGITWTLNLKAMIHIFGKRTSWIAQVGLWGDIIGQMGRELRTKVDPMFGFLTLPQCIKNGKYVGCPVSGTNAERITGLDGMPPCPLWVRYQNDEAMDAANKASELDIPGRDQAAWDYPEDSEDGPAEDIRNWEAEDPIQEEMLHTNAKKFGDLWGIDLFDPKLEVA